MEKYRDKYAGKTVVLIGNGSSIAGLPKGELEQIASKHKIAACNYWYPFGKEMFGIDPDIYCIGDLINVGFKPYKQCKDLFQVKNSVYEPIYKRYYDSFFTNTLLKRNINQSPLQYISKNKLDTKTDIFLVSTNEFAEEMIRSKCSDLIRNYELVYGYQMTKKDINYRMLAPLTQKQKINDTLGTYYYNDKLFFHRKFNVIFAYLMRLLAFLGVKNIVFLGVDCSRSGYFYNPLNNHIDKNNQYFKSREFKDGTKYYSQERLDIIRGKIKALTIEYGVKFWFYPCGNEYHYGDLGTKLESTSQLLSL